MGVLWLTQTPRLSFWLELQDRAGVEAGGRTETGDGRGAPSEQQGQVVASRPCKQVPPVAYFFPDAAAGVGFRGMKSSNWSPGLWRLRGEGAGAPDLRM